MEKTKSISFGFWVAGLVGTLLCMALSAAGMQQATYGAAVATLVLIAFGFVFARIYKSEQEALAARRRKGLAKAQGMVEAACAALDAYRDAQVQGADAEMVAELRRKAENAAMEAVFTLGEAQATPRELALVATQQASEAQKKLQALVEENAPQEELARAREEAVALSFHAVEAIRAMLAVTVQTEPAPQA